MSEYNCFRTAHAEWDKCGKVSNMEQGPDITQQVCYILVKMEYDRCMVNLKKQVIKEHKEENARQNEAK
jgi:hypothetical protein